MTGLVALAGWLAYALARWQTWASGQLGHFLMVGHKYSHPAQLAPHIGLVPSAGYDGQFYYRLALNPFNWQHTAYGITIDQPYRYTRIGYPVITWIVSFGSHALVPVMLLAVNLAAMAAIGVLGGLFARESGRHALWGLLFVAYFGLAISVGRDTAEPLADACMLGGMLAYRHSRYLLAAVLLAYGTITNELVLILCVGIALTRLYAMYRRRARPGLADLAWVLPGGAYVLITLAERVVVKGKSAATGDATRNLTFPFEGMARGLYHDVRGMSWTHLGMYDINLIEFVTLIAFLLAGFMVLRRTTAPDHERIAFVLFVLIEVVMASWEIWGSVFGEGRVFLEAYLFAVIMLLATPKKALPTKQLGIIAAIAVPALLVVARRHILHQ